MKRIILLLIPILLMIIIVVAVLKLFILQDSGKGALQVTSQPLSKVYLDNTYIGNTPLCRCEATTMIRNGEYTIKLVPLDSSLPEFQEKITITKNVLTVVDRKFGKGALSEGSIISLTPLADKKATELLVLSFPNSTDVYVDANPIGTTPISLKKLTVSDHSLKVKKEGYKDKNVRIRTPAGYKLTATVYLSLLDGVITPTPQTPVASISGRLSPTATRLSPTQTKVSVTPTKLSGTPAKVSGKVVILQTPNGFLRVRKTPSLTAAEVTRVSTGQTFDLLDEQTGWYKIKVQTGTEGWISAQYASKQ